jgi:hypothetical protein
MFVIWPCKYCCEDYRVALCKETSCSHILCFLLNMFLSIVLSHDRELSLRM